MRAAAVAALAAGMAAVAPAATQPAASPEVVVHVGWNPPDKPTRVEFDGGAPFVENGSEHVGRRPQTSPWLTSDLAIVYAADEFPLRVVTEAGQGPVRFRVIHARYAQCTPKDVLDVWSARPATMNSRIALMIQARALLVSGICPETVRWKLAKRYFDTSCALAQDADNAIDLSPDARSLYREYARTPAQKREAESCTAKRQQAAINRLRAEVARAQSGGDTDRFLALNGELIRLAQDPRWAGGFEVLQLDADLFRAAEAKDLYQRQTRAYHGGDAELALKLNDELTALKGSDDYAEALSMVRITEQRLAADRVLFEAAASQ